MHGQDSRDVHLAETDQLHVRGDDRTEEIRHVNLFEGKSRRQLKNADDALLSKLTWTTSLPSIEPVLWTVTVTSKSSFVPIVEPDNCKSVLRARISICLANRYREWLNALVERCVTQSTTEAPCRNGGVENVLADPGFRTGDHAHEEHLPGVQTTGNHSGR